MTADGRPRSWSWCRSPIVRWSSMPPWPRSPDDGGAAKLDINTKRERLLPSAAIHAADQLEQMLAEAGPHGGAGAQLPRSPAGRAELPGPRRAPGEDLADAVADVRVPVLECAHPAAQAAITTRRS